MTTLAVTGGTGFVGSHLLRIAHENGVTVRALARSPQPALPGVTWVHGSLSDRDGLARLVEGSDAVLHIAGVINARTRAEFDAGNVAGTAALLDAAKAAGVGRFVHVSSLAAREPGLSVYGASKAAAEALVTASGLDWDVIRPPGVYGPGDRETLALFRMVNSGVALLPTRGRLSMIEVGDLSRALLAVTAASPARAVAEIDDAARRDAQRGITHADFARAIGTALDKRPLLVTAPPWLVQAAATADTGLARLSNRLPKLSHDRARYLMHPDWVAQGDNLASRAIWTPQVTLDDGLAATARWYRAAGWL
jgi:nucleoside-diphosphate-sugar epimerase